MHMLRIVLTTIVLFSSLPYFIVERIQAVTPPSCSGPCVLIDKTSYTSGEIIYITLVDLTANARSKGSNNVEEWIGLYVASNPDTSSSFQRIWQYLNGQKTPPAPTRSWPLNSVRSTRNSRDRLIAIMLICFSMLPSNSDSAARSKKKETKEVCFGHWRES